MNTIFFKRLFIAVLSTLCLSTGFAQKQHGKASYYSKRSTGARTASGQRLHHDSLTCAHRFYPFGTHLKVTNLSNNKSVVVKVIDRGPFGRGRIIDLSWAAAKEIGMISQGVATVKVELLENPIPYRPEEAKLPTIDFEVAESDYKLKPRWQTSKTAKEKGKEKGKEKEQEGKAKELTEAKKEMNSKKEANNRKEQNSKKETSTKKETSSSKETKSNSKSNNKSGNSNKKGKGKSKR